MGRYMDHKCYSYYSILINAINTKIFYLKFFNSIFLNVENEKLEIIICDLLIYI